jgi:DNA polymerase zeta
MFVLLKWRSREEAFRIGKEIASSITAMNPLLKISLQHA